MGFMVNLQYRCYYKICNVIAFSIEKCSNPWKMVFGQ